MKKEIHPTWYQAQVRCTTCDTRWVTGATVETLTVEICSNCHPFYTGEQRIVDTEGQVDRFMKRLQARDQHRDDIEAREAAKTPADLPLSELELTTRTLNILEGHEITNVADFFAKLDAGGEESILELQGVGRKILADLKKTLRARGYELPSAEGATEE